eukprot:SAG22_NODE_20375_length_266_cov_0.676647_1_plen_42_part_10
MRAPPLASSSWHFSAEAAGRLRPPAACGPTFFLLGGFDIAAI